MSTLFGTVLRMSLTGSYCILIVLFLRALLFKAPKKFSYALWLVVFVRLICPMMPEGRFSLIPDRDVLEAGGFDAGGILGHADGMPGAEPVERDFSGTAFLQKPESLQEGDAAGQAADNPAQGAEGLTGEKIFLKAGAVIWLFGAAVFGGWHVVSYFRFKRRVSGAAPVEDGVYEIREGHLSFVLGIIKPRIYLSEGLSPETRRVVLCHEQMHIKRRDYLLKPAALAVCCLHWFNPLVWLAFYLMNKDCEMSCDECVVGRCGEGSKRVYSYALLHEAQAQRVRVKKGGVGALLSFGEDNVRKRIAHVLHYRSIPRWGFLLILLLIVPVALGLVFNPAARKLAEEDFLKAVREAGGYGEESTLQCYMGDYEGDGVPEAFVTVNGSDGQWDGAIWFVSDTGGAGMLEEQVVFLEETDPIHHYLGDREYLFFTLAEGNSWITNMYGVKDDRPFNALPDVENAGQWNNELECLVSAYDIVYFAEDGLTTGRSVKPYYFHYLVNPDGSGEFQEDLAMEWTVQDVALSGGQEILDSLTEKYGLPLEHFQYLCRDNGLLHVNIAVPDEDSLTFSYETWRETDAGYVLEDQGDGFYLQGVTVEGGESYKDKATILLDWYAQQQNVNGLSEDAKAVEQVVTGFYRAYFAGDIDVFKQYLVRPYEWGPECLYDSTSDIGISAVKGLEEIGDKNIGDTCSVSVEYLDYEESDDAYRYLTVELIKTEDGWKIYSYGIEG